MKNFISTYQHSDITEKIIGAAMKVHSSLGCGFKEVIYQRSLSLQLNAEHIFHEREKEYLVYYENELVGIYKADLVVNEKVIVELKVADEITDQHIAQILTYLYTSKLKVGLILNFGQRSLEVRRIENFRI